jgi:hypothetical protein
MKHLRLPWLLGSLLAAAAPSSCGTGPLDALGLAPGALSAGRVAHFAFDEGTGATVHDSSGNAHDGTINGSTWSWLPQGRFGGALHLAPGDYVAVADFPNATSGWTVAAWVQLASNDPAMGEATVLSTEAVFKGGWEINVTPLDGALAYHFGFWTGPGSYDYDHYECQGCVHSGQWQHLAAVVDATAHTLAFYLDGVLQTRQSVRQAISPGVPTLYMGRWATSDPARLLQGSLDDVAIWDRALVSPEVALLTQAPAP